MGDLAWLKDLGGLGVAAVSVVVLALTLKALLTKRNGHAPQAGSATVDFWRREHREIVEKALASHREQVMRALGEIGDELKRLGDYVRDRRS